MAYIGVQPAEAYTSFAVQHFTTSATTSYTLDNPVANENEIALFINNVRQQPGSSYAYTASGTTLTLSAATSASDTMYCVFIGKAVQTVTPTLPIANFSSTGIDDNATSTAITIDSSENVGIGTTSPSRQFQVSATDAQISALSSTSSGSSAIHFGDSDDDNVGQVNYQHSDNSMRLTVNASEAMRIDSSGRLLVGKTSAGTATAGAEMRDTGLVTGTVDGGHCSNFNRLSTDGEIIRIQKDGTTEGSIGKSDTTGIFVSGPTSTGGGLVFQSNEKIQPAKNGVRTDNEIDIGSSGFRFDDIFATNGTIQTSDQNEKQSIQALTSTEIAVAKRISKLFKTFKWNSAVEEKGDNARTHTGIIAQDVQQAFTDEGLNASNYALFISSTWWENEEGDIKEEATEGYTERTRLGIRYPELLSFISSAFEQRLTDIETRLTTLEGN